MSGETLEGGVRVCLLIDLVEAGAFSRAVEVDGFFAGLDGVEVDEEERCRG